MMKSSISYCPRCEKQGLLIVLGERIYLSDEPIPRDRQIWKQCHTFGQLVSIYEAKNESRLVDFVETSDNPFENSESVFLSTDSRATQARKGKKSKADFQLMNMKILKLKQNCVKVIP